MFSVRLTKRRMLIGVLAVVLAGVGIVGVRAIGKEEMASAVPAVETPEERAKPKKITAKTEEERLAFIAAYGWEVSPDGVEVMEVIIPAEFDQVYLDYNAIQKMQGFDLEKYAGKRCKRYSYLVTNYPGTDSEVRLNLLQSGDKIVGGDVCSTQADGFMHGFSPEVG